MARAYFFCGLRMARSGISPGPGARLPALGTVALTWGVRADTLMSHRMTHPGPDPRPRPGPARTAAGPMTSLRPGGQPRAAVTHAAQAGHVGAYRMLRFAVPGAGRYPYLTSMSISMPAVPRSV